MTTTESDSDPGHPSIKIMPGYMVLIRTKVEGGVHYEREELDHHREGGAEVKSWNTQRRIEDKEEYEAACGVRNTARALIVRGCIKTPFREICEKAKKPELDAAIVEARQVIGDFNDGTSHSTVKLYIMIGEIAEDESEAIEAITGEIKDLLGDLDGSIRRGEVAQIREIAARARTMGKMLDQEERAKGELDRAVRAARRIATSIARKVGDGGEALADVLASANFKPITLARFTFGDEDVEPPEGQEPEDSGPALPSIAGQRFLDLSTDADQPTDPEPTTEQGRFTDLTPVEND